MTLDQIALGSDGNVSDIETRICIRSTCLIFVDFLHAQHFWFSNFTPRNIEKHHPKKKQYQVCSSTISQVIHSQGETIKRLRAENTSMIGGRKKTIISQHHHTIILSFSEGGDSDSGVVLCDSEFSDATIELSDAAIELSDATIELSDAAIEDMAEINLRVNKEGMSGKDLVVLEVNSERDQNHQSLVKRVQLNHRYLSQETPCSF